MTEEVVTADYAADADIAQPKKRGRPPRFVEEPSEPVNTIINLEPPQIIITKAEEPAEEIKVPISEQTRREMEAGRKIVDSYR
jgi:hypothetical protein